MRTASARSTAPVTPSAAPNPAEPGPPPVRVGRTPTRPVPTGPVPAGPVPAGPVPDGSGTSGTSEPAPGRTRSTAPWTSDRCTSGRSTVIPCRRASAAKDCGE
ncbi:hypothetical protein GALL_412840 [mine drainage metagenome]|uniref:Uncharacterized protein n=1 Tax=mine drainage metagenome TaxID=410659 RepID=A0A1J5QLX8_9ZZZZ